MPSAGGMLWVLMGKFFATNIDRRGRIVRAVWGAALITVGVLIFKHHPWVCIGLVACGVFAVYEAVRGWCLMRACGIKTKV